MKELSIHPKDGLTGNPVIEDPKTPTGPSGIVLDIVAQCQSAQSEI